MKSEDIFDGVTDIRDDLIDGVQETSKKKKRWPSSVGFSYDPVAG